MTDQIIPPHGGYRKLASYQMATIVYDATVEFCNRFIEKRSRTHDQMVQAARSGKQNIAEGTMASGTSKKTELKLVGIARASLEELLQDYEDFVRQHGLKKWHKDDERALKIRSIGRDENKSYLSYKTYLESPNPEVPANTMMCIINQTNYLLDRQLKVLEQEFIQKGGITERMYNVRKNHKKENESALLNLAKKRFDDNKGQKVHFSNNIDIDNFLNDLEKHPHAFVLACLMDRQMKAEKAWLIPYLIKEELSSFDIDVLVNVSLESFKEIFNRKRLHRFNDTMAEVFYKGVHHIFKQYSGDASKIWCNTPSSSSVVFRFLEFSGGGIKIATMAANILARQFRIPFSDYYSIDISHDVYVKRVMMRMGFVPHNASNEMILYKARELNPEFPGIIDFSCWEIGRNWCRPLNPLCEDCIIKEDCSKKL